MREIATLSMGGGPKGGIEPPAKEPQSLMLPLYTIEETLKSYTTWAFAVTVSIHRSMILTY